MSRCSNNLDITLGDTVFTDLDYADDAVLFTQDSGRWQADLKHFDEAATTMGTSWEKMCQRRILGIRWNDFITNRAVSDSTNLPSILCTIAARRHSIFGHIRRLPDRTPAPMALKLAVNTRSGHTTPRLESPSW